LRMRGLVHLVGVEMVWRLEVCVFTLCLESIHLLSVMVVRVDLLYKED